jgi:hypothetical protein
MLPCGQPVPHFPTCSFFSTGAVSSHVRNNGKRSKALRSHLADHPPGRPVWRSTRHEKAAAMLRRDLAAASIPYVVEGPEGSLYLDFHALRHGYVALLDKARLSLKEATQLAHHLDPKLTMARYGRAPFHDLATAVKRLPRLLPGEPGADRQVQRPTGTGGRITDPARLSCPVLVRTPDSGCVRLRLEESRCHEEAENASDPNRLILQGVEASRERSRRDERSSGDWDRTSDTRLMKPLL